MEKLLRELSDLRGISGFEYKKVDNVDNMYSYHI